MKDDEERVRDNAEERTAIQQREDHVSASDLFPSPPEKESFLRIRPSMQT